MAKAAVRAATAAAVLVVVAGCDTRIPPRPAPIPPEVVERVSAAVTGPWQAHLETTIVDDLTLEFAPDGTVTGRSPRHDAAGWWRVTGDGTFSYDLRAPAGPPAWPIEGTVSVSLTARLDPAGDRFSATGTGTFSVAPDATTTSSLPFPLPSSWSAPATMTAARSVESG